MSADQRLISCASTLPSGATEANFRTSSSARRQRRREVTSETDSESKIITKKRMGGAQDYHAGCQTVMLI